MRTPTILSSASFWRGNQVDGLPGRPTFEYCGRSGLERLKPREIGYPTISLLILGFEAFGSAAETAGTPVRERYLRSLSHRAGLPQRYPNVGRRGKPSTWLPRQKLAEERIVGVRIRARSKHRDLFMSVHHNEEQPKQQEKT